MFSDEFFKKNKKFLLAGVFILAAFFIFFNLTRADIQNDDAIYSFRSIGYLDYTDSQLQTTPIKWFDEIPAWSKLSFHDAPPLVFIIQFVFFKIFGVSDLAAKLPFALAGLGSVILFYFLAEKLYNYKTALLASFILSVLTYHSWASRVGYLEPISLFFVLLTFYLFFTGLRHPKVLPLFGLSMGVAFLTKYTTFFILPVVVLYLIFKKPKKIFSINFILSLLIALLIFSPVLYYNYQIYQTRNHLDLQFSQLFGMDMSDWPGISGGGVSGNYFGQFAGIWQEAGKMISAPLYVLFMLSAIYLLVNFVINYRRKQYLFLVLAIIFLSVQFTLTGGEVRFLSLLTPFIALTLAIALYSIYDKYISQLPEKDIKKKFLAGLLGIVLVIEILFNLNTNILASPVGEEGKHYSENRLENVGFAELNKFFTQELNLDGLKKVKINSLADAGLDPSKDLADNNLVIYDPNSSWFSTLWYFRRWAVFYHQPFVSAVDIAIILQGEDWFEFFKALEVDTVYYVWAQDRNFYSGSSKPRDIESARNLAQIFAQKEAEVFEITNRHGEVAFRVYKLKLDNI